MFRPKRQLGSALFWAFGGLMLTSAFSLSGQQNRTSATRITADQTAALLKQDPTLSKGFTTPQNATVQVLKPVEGGVLLRFHRNDGTHGELTVVGPPTVMEKGFWGRVADAIAEIVKQLPTDGGGKGGGKGGTCVNVNITGS